VTGELQARTDAHASGDYRRRVAGVLTRRALADIFDLPPDKVRVFCERVGGGFGGKQEMFVEINPAAANDRGIRDGEKVWVKSPTGAKILVHALVTERVDRETVWLPFHFSGHWQGADLLQYYPEGAHPVVRGEAVNTATTYGYDSVTMMQETKTTVCQVERA